MALKEVRCYHPKALAQQLKKRRERFSSYWHLKENVVKLPYKLNWNPSLCFDLWHVVCELLRVAETLIEVCRALYFEMRVAIFPLLGFLSL